MLSVMWKPVIERYSIISASGEEYAFVSVGLIVCLSASPSIAPSLSVYQEHCRKKRTDGFLKKFKDNIFVNFELYN